MRRHILPAMALAALAALALPVVADAQTPREGGRMGQPGRMTGMPAERIIALREELGLTDAQVEQIRGIQTELQEQNRPLHEQLTSARQEGHARRQEMTPEQREQMQQRRSAMRDSMRARASMPARDSMQARAISDELRPVMEQLRSNTASAMQRIQSTLTDEQQQKLRELRPAQRRQGAPGARRGPGRDRLPGAARGSR